MISPGRTRILVTTSMLLERICGVDFCDISYGFRSGRSCHQASSALGQLSATKKVSWISDSRHPRVLRTVHIHDEAITDPDRLSKQFGHRTAGGVSCENRHESELTIQC